MPSVSCNLLLLDSDAPKPKDCVTNDEVIERIEPSSMSKLTYLSCVIVCNENLAGCVEPVVHHLPEGQKGDLEASSSAPAAGAVTSRTCAVELPSNKDTSRLLWTWRSVIAESRPTNGHSLLHNRAQAPRKYYITRTWNTKWYPPSVLRGDFWLPRGSRQLSKARGRERVTPTPRSARRASLKLCQMTQCLESSQPD